MSHTIRRTQADRSADTRALLIKAATELLQTSGFAATTTARIAQRAGVTTGALHHHFPSKDDLMLGVLDHGTERIRSRLDQAGPAPLDAAQIVAHLWEVYGDPEYRAIWEIIIGAQTDGAFHQRVAADRLATMRNVLHPWVRRQKLPAAVQPDAIALFEFTLIAIRGLSLERFLDKDAAYFERNLRILADMLGHQLASLSASRGRPSLGTSS